MKPATVLVQDHLSVPIGASPIDQMGQSSVAESRFLVGQFITENKPTLENKSMEQHQVEMTDYDKYTGEFRQRFRHGYGISQRSNGDRYEGYWDTGLMHGKGTYFSSDSNTIFKGIWEYGHRRGLGTEQDADGSVFMGSWEGSAKNGQGFLVFGDGTIIKGHWNDDKLSGKATFIYSNGDFFCGHLIESQRRGRGVYTFARGDVVEAEWTSHESGVGVITYSTGEIYRGQIRSNEKHGHGEYWYSDGSYYSGQWRNNIKCGNGVLITASHRHIKGFWRKNRLICEDDTLQNFLMVSALSHSQGHPGLSPPQGFFSAHK